MSTYFNRDKELENYLEKYNEEFPERNKLDGEISEVFSFIDRLNFNSSSRAFKKADFFTLFVELHRALIKNSLAVDAGTLRGLLDDFYARVDRVPSGDSGDDREAQEYYSAALQASNDRSSRITRGESIYALVQNSAS